MNYPSVVRWTDDYAAVHLFIWIQLFVYPRINWIFQSQQTIELKQRDQAQSHQMESRRTIVDFGNGVRAWKRRRRRRRPTLPSYMMMFGFWKSQYFSFFFTIHRFCSIFFYSWWKPPSSPRPLWVMVWNRPTEMHLCSTFYEFHQMVCNEELQLQAVNDKGWQRNVESANGMNIAELNSLQFPGHFSSQSKILFPPLQLVLGYFPAIPTTYHSREELLIHFKLVGDKKNYLTNFGLNCAAKTIIGPVTMQLNWDTLLFVTLDYHIKHKLNLVCSCKAHKLNMVIPLSVGEIGNTEHN